MVSTYIGRRRGPRCGREQRRTFSNDEPRWCRVTRASEGAVLIAIALGAESVAAPRHTTTIAGARSATGRYRSRWRETSPRGRADGSKAPLVEGTQCRATHPAAPTRGAVALVRVVTSCSGPGCGRAATPGSKRMCSWVAWSHVSPPGRRKQVAHSTDRKRSRNLEVLSSRERSLTVGG